MKIIKIVVAVAFILSIQFSLKAQNIIVKAGLTMSDLKISNNTGDLDQFNQMKKNIHFGVFMDRKVNDLISFETGLLYDQKGTEQILNSAGNTITNILSLNTLNLPVSLKIGLDASEDIRLFGKIGGYGGYNLGGTLTSEIMDNTGTLLSDTSSDLQIGTDALNGDQIKPIDYGATLGVGVQYKRISFEIGFDMGLANLSPDQITGEDIKNKEYKFSLGYHFGN